MGFSSPHCLTSTLKALLLSIYSYVIEIVIVDDLLNSWVTSSDAAAKVGASQVTISQLCQHGKIPALKIANRWLIPRAAFEEFAKDYQPRRGRPRTKRKYTKRSPIWNAQ